MRYVAIKYCDPHNHDDSQVLIYKLRRHGVTEKWVQRVLLAQAKYSIDDPGRFYGFGSIEQQTAEAVTRINTCIRTINKHKQLIDRTVTKITDQDTLNYLHHIFEVYHGLLDQQTHEYWLNAPPEVRAALADLNILVHRCETTARGAKPRHVVTWYGLPKTETLAEEDYSLFEPDVKFGTMYLNYVEIGKTFEDLVADNDQYIHDEAFQPFRHYSADFNVKFWDYRQTPEEYAILKQYYDSNQDFFTQRGVYWGHPHLSTGLIPLADLDDSSDDVKLLTTRQWVKSVTFI